jgi:hypothetical protein
MSTPASNYCKSGNHRFVGDYQVIKTHDAHGRILTSRVICADCARERRLALITKSAKSAKASS